MEEEACGKAWRCIVGVGVVARSRGVVGDEVELGAGQLLQGLLQKPRHQLPSRHPLKLFAYLPNSC